MPLFIRDEDVRTMAHRLAEARGTTVTAALREVLRRELAGFEAAAAERDGRLRALFGSWSQEEPGQPWRDAAIYDEDGIPR